MSDGPRKCKAQVTGASGYSFHQCGNRAITDGDYCRVHDPELKKQRRAKRGPTKFERDCETIKAKAAEHEALIAERDRLREELKTAEQQRDHWRRENISSMEAREPLQDRIEELEGQLKGLRHTLDEERKVMAHMVAALEEERLRVKTLQARVKELEAKEDNQ